MNLFDLCIERPVLTLMMTLSLVVFGVLGYSRLGVDQMPEIEFPMVTVQAQLEGAAPQVMEEDVTEVIEEHINAVEGLRSLRSITFHGVASIMAEFELSRDIDLAAQDVRDKVARARYRLPPELDPPIIDKLNMSSRPIIWIMVPSERPTTETTQYVRYTLKPALETIRGVASTDLFGRRDRAIRIWVDDEELRSRGLAATDLIDAIQREHVEIPGGLVESKRIEYSVRTDAEFETVVDLENLIVAHVGGAPVRLRDVARVEDGAEDARHLARYNGEDGAGIGILKQPGANTVAIARATKERLQEMSEFVPSGMSLPDPDSVIDFSTSIIEAVEETQFALVFGALLAILVVFVFLRRARPTLVVASAIPLSIVATFGVIWLFGFTLNIMTLLALTLAVGVVIDDAIVVLENIERHREAGATPREAASRGTRQIAFAATSATVSIAVVFLPVVFVTGIVGSFLGEFGLTVASAVMISLFVALTLTPMLAARIPPPKERAHGGVHHRLEQGFDWLDSHYRTLLAWALSHRGATLGIAAASVLLAVVFGSAIGREFFPPSDEGRLFVMMETAPGTTLAGTRERAVLAEKWMLDQPEVKGLFAGIGVAGGAGPGTVTNAVMVAILTSRDERERSAMELQEEARRALNQIPGLEVQVFNPSGWYGGGGRGEFEFNVRGDISIEELDEISSRFMRELVITPGFADLNKSLKVGLPEVRVIPDRDKAAALGVDARSIARVIQATIGGLDVAKFKEGGHRYDIRMRLEEDERDDPSSIERLYVRGRDGEIHELRNLVRIETGAAPSTITRHDRKRSVTVSANLEGIPVGQAIREVRALAPQILPDGVNISFSGSAEAFLESLSQFGLMIGLSILVIYMVLAAQFESLIHPLTVMLAVPLAMVGALGGLLAMGMTLNIFSLIGIILLIGLVTKNSILIVDFANHLRVEEGLDKLEAMRRAAPIRMRPVLMTAFSMIFGVLPAALGIGPGSETRAPMAVATAAGMLTSTVLTLVVVPVFYLVLDDGVDWLRNQFRPSGRASEDLGVAGHTPSA